MKGKRLSIKKINNFRRSGVRLKPKCKHLDKKVLNCYPRGKAWLRMVYLHSASWSINSTGGKV